MVHAQLATAPASPRADAPTTAAEYGEALAPVSPRADAPPARDGVPYLYYYPDTARLRTPFRDAAIEFIYQAALEVDDGRIKYGYVYVYTPHIEDDVETLDLIFVVDTKDWNVISEWMHEVFGKIIEWEAGLSDAQKKDFRTRVEFDYLPAIYDNETS